MKTNKQQIETKKDVIPEVKELRKAKEFNLTDDMYKDFDAFKELNRKKSK